MPRCRRVTRATEVLARCHDVDASEGGGGGSGGGHGGAERAGRAGVGHGQAGAGGARGGRALREHEPNERAGGRANDAVVLLQAAACTNSVRSTQHGAHQSQQQQGSHRCRVKLVMNGRSVARPFRQMERCLPLLGGVVPSPCGLLMQHADVCGRSGPQLNASQVLLGTQTRSPAHT